MVALNMNIIGSVINFDIKDDWARYGVPLYVG